MQLLKKHIGSKYHNECKVNTDIKSSFIRLIGEQGNQLGVFSRIDALYKAKSLNLDLVEVSVFSTPPVCKLMDYGKFKYEQKRKTAKAKKKQIVINIKEIKFRPKTDTHDFYFKIKNTKKFLFQNKKVKIVIVFKGREIIHIDIGQQMLQKILREVKHCAALDSPPKMEGKQLVIILSPAKQK